MHSIQKAKMLGRCRQEMMRGIFTKTHLLKQTKKQQQASTYGGISFLLS